MHRTLALLLLGAAPLAAQFGANYRDPPIAYGTHPTTDAVARLRDRLARGETRLEHDGIGGYLGAVLRELRVPVSTQGLVFSKTSFQIRQISPRNPRAVYFGDEVYVGFVPGGEVLELTAMDPVRGPIFYTLDQAAGGRPEIARRTSECLTCHGSSRTADWPGNLVRSVHALPTGDVVTRVGSHVTTHASPFEQRWGGWYVTGTHGAMRHRGNVTATEGAGDADAPPTLDPEAGANVTSLAGRFPLRNYPSPHSDLVALMVLEHQTEMHNRIARATYRVRRALHLLAAHNRALDRPADHRDARTEGVIKDAANEVLEHLLFKHEARLTAPVRGTSAFAAKFSARGPEDPQGRSLRQLDLQTRLFRYPCSYVIYSPSFDAMPAPVLERVYARLYRVLSGRIGRRSWGLTRAQRQAILDILLATKPGLAERWQRIEVR